MRSVVKCFIIAHGYGRNNPVMARLDASRQMSGGIYIGEGDTLVSSVYINDLAKLYRLALVKTGAGYILITTVGSPTSTKKSLRH